MDYIQADKLLQGRNYTSRKIANNTYLIRDNNSTVIHVRLHSTNIITFHSDFSTTINTDGWHTVTTKDRLNKYLPNSWRIYQSKRVWYLNHYGTQYPFQDGITIHANGEVTGIDTSYLLNTPANDKALKKYAKEYIAALFAGKVPHPSSGDCWYCSFKWWENGSPEHILSHFEESYFVPSMLVNAIESFPVSGVAKSELSAIWSSDYVYHKDNAWVNIGKQQLKKSLMRYLKRQLGFAA